MSGAQIGGVIGAVVGSFIPGVGTQIGFMIGSAIGGYIDPTQIKGPRLNDAMSQTSNVGVPLPFGYGRFPTAGNIIWRDPTLKEIAKRSRGKGGGTKTTTYSYTRSYAIGVCEGPIYGFLHIKRNGKLVYSSDPAATIEDKKYSAKWLQKAKLYYGTETQMPDSTITAVEGAGNVAPFRGLAYIVVENDDLTDLAGAIPQYEFCVIATPPEAYLTSHVYTQYVEDRMQLRSQLESASTRQIVMSTEIVSESLEVQPGFFAAGTRAAQWAFDQYPEMMELSPKFLSASTKDPLVKYVAPPEDFYKIGPVLLAASTKQALFTNTVLPDAMSVTPLFIGASTA